MSALLAAGHVQLDGDGHAQVGATRGMLIVMVAASVIAVWLMVRAARCASAADAAS